MKLKLASEYSPTATGIFKELPAAIYHADPGFSNSMGKHLDPPARLPVYLTEKQATTAAMLMGSVIHQRILEPETPFGRFAIVPEFYPAPEGSSLVKSKKVAVGDPVPWHWASNHCKAWRQNVEASGKIVVTGDEAELIVRCAQSVLEHPAGRMLFDEKEGQPELSVFTDFFYREHGVEQQYRCKARIDYDPGGNALVDIKTVPGEGASAENFAKTMFDYDYHVQAAFYLDIFNAASTGQRKENFFFIVVEKAPPYLVNVFQVEGETIALGRLQYEHRLKTYLKCVREKFWPGFGNQVNPLALPDWAKKKIAAQRL